MGIIFALFSIHFYITPPKTSEAIQIMSTTGISNITISLFCAILSVVAISTVLLSKYNMNNTRKYLILFIIVFGIICMFAALCIFNFMLGIIFGSFLFIMTFLIAYKLVVITNNCPKLNKGV